MTTTRNRSLPAAIWKSFISARVALLIFLGVLCFFVRFPLALLALLVLGLAYSLYRIIKGWKASGKQRAGTCRRVAKNRDFTHRPNVPI